jgi:hypothetical protein
MAAPPVGTGDPDTQTLLNNAYTQARQDPQMQGAGIPSGLLKPYSGPPGGSSQSSTTVSSSPTEPPPGSVSVDDAPEGAENPFDGFKRATPPPGALPADGETHGDGNPWSWTSIHDFARDEFRGTGEEIGKGVMRGLAKAGAGATVLAGGAAAKTADTVADWVVNGTTKALGIDMPEQHIHGAEDAVFDFKKNYIDPAIDYWTPKRQEQTGQGEGSGGAAQALGGAAELLPAVATGAAGGASILAGQAADTMTKSIDSGHDLRTTAAEGAVDTIGTAVQMLVPGAKLPFLKRAMLQVPVGDFAAVTQSWAKKQVLQANGHQDEADKIDPIEGLGENTLQNIVFAAIGGEKKSAETSAPAPVPGATPAGTGASPAAPASPVKSPEPVTQTPAKPAEPTAVPDKPTPEPAKDLKAQFADMNDKTTPRTGVLVSKGSEDAAGGALTQAQAQGRTIDFPQGTLVLKNKAEFLKTQELVKKGTDPQEVIGKATGAGTGKTPDANIVVQGQTKDGAVATEGMVKPSEVNSKIAEVQAQGKEPVVTSPELAVQRRADEIQKESGAPPEGAQTVGNAEPPKGAESVVDEAARKNMTVASTAEVRRMNEMLSREPVKNSDTHEEADEDEEQPGLTATRGIVKTPNGERAVHIEDSTPDKDGKIAVKMLDDSGEPTGTAIKVSQDLVRGNKSSALEPAKESTPEKVDTKETPVVESKAPAPVVAETESTALSKESEGSAAPEPTPKAKSAPLIEQLADAKAQFQTDSTPPVGKKYPASVKDRAGTVSNFARVLKGVAEHLTGKASATDIQHAIAVAKKAERLDLKSDEAIKKNQGVGHTELAVHEHNLMEAAQKLIDPDHEIAPAKVAVQEKLKAKQAAKREPKPEAKVTEPESPKEKTAIKDVEDETKPKVLSKQDQLRLKAAGDKLIRARDEDVDARRTDVEKMIREIYGDRMSPDDHEAFMHFLMAERRDRLTPKTRDEEVDEEFGDHRFENASHDDDGADLKILSQGEVSPETAKMTQALEKSSLYPKLREAARNNMQFPADKILQHMAGQTEKGPLRDFIHKLAAHLPAGTMLRPMGEVGAGRNGAAAAGHYSLSTGVAQLRVRDPSDAAKMTHTILHELVHAATMHLARQEPNHPFVREAEHLRQVFENRMRARIGDAPVNEHLAYYRGTGPRPNDVIAHTYGLMNHTEFMAEAMSNPKFQQMIAESEKYKSNYEGFFGGVHKLADAVVGAVQRALNIVSNREAKLLHAVMRNVEDVMETQRSQYDAQSSRTAEAALGDLAHLNDDPKPLREEWKVRSAAGDTAATTARQFYRATQSRAVHALRELILKNETHDQIIRSNAHWFGHDDATNPLRQYDDTQQQKTATTERILGRAKDIVRDRNDLTRAESTELGAAQIKATSWGIDPTKPQSEVADKISKRKDFQQRWDEVTKQYNDMNEAQKGLFNRERDHYAYMQKQTRRIATDAALDTFSDKDISAAQRSLLYNAKSKADFDDLIGSGKLVDVGDRNDSLKASLKDLASVNNVTGPYFHLGRSGEYVVQVKPEGSRDFNSQAEAEDYAGKIRDFGPGSKAKVAEIGGKWNVDYKAQHVSMHETAYQAEHAADSLRAQGHDVGQVTRKVQAQSGGALTAGMKTLVAEASRKLERRGSGPETQALADSLRGTFVQMVAARSSYASSKLARKGFAGVKPEEMGRNFANHTQSMAWNLGNLATVFKQGEALGRIREMSKSPEAEVSQKTVYKRGAVMDIIGKRLAQEVSQYGLKNPVNAVTAKLGYMNFLASPAHTIVNLTQNFTTAIPVGAARWGLGKTAAAFADATRVVSGPTLRATMNAFKGRMGADDMAEAVVKAVAQDPKFGKYAPQLRELMDRGIMNSTFASELGVVGRGGNRNVQAVFDYARIMPQLAEVYNRVSTALVGLHLTGGDIQKTSDFVKEAHIDYTQQNKTLVAKSIAKVPGANTLTMFRTYVQGMRHLLYSNIKNMVVAETKSRAEAATTVAGLILAQSLFAGVIKGAVLEPLRASVYAYNKLFGDSDKFYDLDNSIRRFISGMVGNKTGADAISGGLPHLLGFDLSGRMGLSDLFLHDPPDLLAMDKDKFMQFLGTQLGGPMGQMVAEQKDQFVKAQDRGDAFGMLSALVPIKLLRDSLKAYELGTTGKRSGAGGQLTKPSGADAAMQAMGLKPSDVAQAQEKQGTVANYKQFVSERKQRIINETTNGKLSPSLMDQVRQYNAANPGDRISVADFRKQQRSAQKAQATAQGGPTKDPEVRKLTGY